MLLYKAFFLFTLSVLLSVNALEDKLVELLKNGGYLLNPEEKTPESIQQELDHLKVGLENAVHLLKNGSQKQTTGNKAGDDKSILVFQVGIVVKEKKQTRRIDFIQWARQINMRAVALGRRYVGVSFELENTKSRLYLFFVEEKEIQNLELSNGRNELGTKIKELFDNLKAEDNAIS